MFHAPRIAYFSPLPPVRSGIADYSLELLPALSEVAHLTVFADSPLPSSLLNVAIEQDDMERFPGRLWEFDAVLYQIGNSEHHDQIVEMAQRFPGIVVLHDYVLHHALARRTIVRGDRFAYRREMAYARGAAGAWQALSVEQGESPPLFDIPLNERLLDASLGIFVHSEYSRRRIQRQRPGRQVAVIPAPISLTEGRSRRAELGLNDGDPLFACFGLLTREKQVEDILKALAQLRVELSSAKLLLVGDVLSDVPLDKLTRELGLESAVYQLGFVPALSEFVDWITTSDVVINLRHPTIGETSATALRALAAGKPLIVTADGWYNELPDPVAIKVSAADSEALLAAMTQLGMNEALCQEMGEAGRHFVRTHNSPRAAARAYVREAANLQTSLRLNA